MNTHILPTLALAALLLGPGAGSSPADDKAEKDEQKKFQGEWRAESIKTGDGSTPAEELKKFRLVIEGDRWTVETGAGKTEWTWKVDPSKSPRALDITTTSGKEVVVRCLYELKGDTLTVCAPLKDLGERPKEIAVAPGFSVAVWKRDKK
jgi:uncharacterized protein (TIGR03067 family)